MDWLTPFGLIYFGGGIAVSLMNTIALIDVRAFDEMTVKEIVMTYIVTLFLWPVAILDSSNYQ